MSEVRRSGPVLMQLRRAPTTGLDEEKPMEVGAREMLARLVGRVTSLRMGGGK